MSESHSWDVSGEVALKFDDGTVIDCRSVCVFSPMGIETWLYIDKDTGELVLAEQIDGDWVELDLEAAKEEFADVIYAAG